MENRNKYSRSADAAGINQPPQHSFFFFLLFVLSHPLALFPSHSFAQLPPPPPVPQHTHTPPPASARMQLFIVILPISCFSIPLASPQKTHTARTCMGVCFISPLPGYLKMNSKTGPTKMQQQQPQPSLLNNSALFLGGRASNTRRRGLGGLGGFPFGIRDTLCPPTSHPSHRHHPSQLSWKQG